MQKVKEGMTGRGIGGRGHRLRNPKEEWGWGDGGWFQPSSFYPPPMGPLMGSFHPPPLGPFGYFPNQALAKHYFSQGQHQVPS